MIFSLGHSEEDSNETDFTVIDYDGSIYKQEGDEKTDTVDDIAEFQYFRKSHQYSVIAGGGYFNRKMCWNTSWVITKVGSVGKESSHNETDDDFRYTNAYSYSYWYLNMFKDFSWTAGISYRIWKKNEINEDKVNPKSDSFGHHITR